MRETVSQKHQRLDREQKSQQAIESYHATLAAIDRSKATIQDYENDIDQYCREVELVKYDKQIEQAFKQVAKLNEQITALQNELAQQSVKLEHAKRDREKANRYESEIHALIRDEERNLKSLLIQVEYNKRALPSDYSEQEEPSTYGDNASKIARAENRRSHAQS